MKPKTVEEAARAVLHIWRHPEIAWNGDFCMMRAMDELSQALNAKADTLPGKR